jgi:hypothetical protein
MTTSVSISGAVSEPEWKDTLQAHHAAIPVALAIMDDLASVRLELEQWALESKLAAAKGTSTADQSEADLLQRHTTEEENIKDRIEAGIKRQDLKVMEEAFQRFAQKGQTITKQQYILLLEELGMYKAAEDIEGLFRSRDHGTKGGLDWEEFKSVMLIPSTVEQLITALPISRLIANAMPIEKGREPLRALSTISPEQIKASCSVLVPYLQKILEDAVHKLKESFELMERMKTSMGAGKFEAPSEMSAGSVEDFFGGLAARIGMQSFCTVAFIGMLFLMFNHVLSCYHFLSCYNSWDVHG